jgi:secreted trypsin-like serine protease
MYISSYLALAVGALGFERRLIIEGDLGTMNRHPYMISLMFCKPTSLGVACASFCSGSLIAKDVVLTAGHCVYSLTESGFGSPVSTVPLSNMFALVGSSDWKDLNNRSGARLVKVSHVVNRGYGLNLRYPMDDDVGLVFLSECVELVPGRIGTIKIDSSNGLTSEKGGCNFVTTLGFGRSANVPSELFVHDGRMRELAGDFIHSHETCQKAYVEAHVKFGFGAEIFSTEELGRDISVDKHICSGGNSVASTCFGDSGGPMVMDDMYGDPTVVGVVSFSPLNECMISPDFGARVSNYAAWIGEQISIFGKKCQPVESSFSVWPPVASKITESNGRCPQWQCARSGECLSLHQVCDGNIHCKDASDEDLVYCKAAYMKLELSGRQERMEQVHSDQWAAPIGVVDEFELLLAKTVAAQNDGDISRYGAETTEGNGVIIIGILESIGGKMRSSRKSEIVRSRKIVMNSTSCREAKLRFGKCTLKIDAVSTQLMDEIEIGQNRFENNPEPIVEVCSELTSCLFSGSQQSSISEWLEDVNTCIDPKIPSPLLGLAQFCGEKVPYFMTLKDARTDYAESFIERFDEPKCVYNRLLVGFADKATTNFNVYYIICIVLLVSILSN